MVDFEALFAERRIYTAGGIELHYSVEQERLFVCREDGRIFANVARVRSILRQAANEMEFSFAPTLTVKTDGSEIYFSLEAPAEQVLDPQQFINRVAELLDNQ